MGAGIFSFAHSYASHTFVFCGLTDSGLTLSMRAQLDSVQAALHVYQPLLTGKAQRC